ncbi:hypothetical protein EYF80_012372 [Liparis tanakae]|uniref:Uncharacterized protein n=1 Tax=Liparis tanakae TaxID=230148 RepID=A0A4Z2IHT8_9TELE|nr:hypothetical protein EYF80_012372 [Liparis tanakae]
MEFMTAGPMSAACEGSESLHRSSCDCSSTLPLEDGAKLEGRRRGGNEEKTRTQVEMREKENVIAHQALAATPTLHVTEIPRDEHGETDAILVEESHNLVHFTASPAARPLPQVCGLLTGCLLFCFAGQFNYGKLAEERNLGNVLMAATMMTTAYISTLASA